MRNFKIVSGRGERSWGEKAVVIGLLVLWVMLPSVGRGDTKFEMSGEYRFRVNWLSDFPVDDRGRELDRNQWQEGRLRISPAVHFGDNLAIYAQADFYSGLMTGDDANLHTDFADWPWDGHEDYEIFDLRQVWVSWTTKFGVLRIGQMSSHWGLGLVANDGEGRQNEFGDVYYGDLVQRTLFATKPFLLFREGPVAERVVFAVGYDTVWRDDNADYEDGDRAHQWIFSLFYDDPDHLFTGVYIALRDQEDDDGDDVDATAYDLYFNWKGKPRPSGAVYSAAFEGAYIRGTTSRVITEAAPSEIDLEGVGAVFRGGVYYPERGLRVGVEIGYASGDANAYDDTNYGFSFDPDYNVGIVLFEEVNSSLSAVAPEALADPNRTASPQKGIDQLPTNGAVTNAFYQSVLICLGPPAPAERGWSVKAGVLHASAVEDYMDPYLTFLNGGVPTNYRGRQNPSHDLGWEFDGAVGYRAGIGSRVKLHLGVEYGYFMPGAAFEDPKGRKIDPVQKLQGRVSISW